MKPSIAELRAIYLKSSHQFEEEIGNASSANGPLFHKTEFSVWTGIPFFPLESYDQLVVLIGGFDQRNSMCRILLDTCVDDRVVFEKGDYASAIEKFRFRLAAPSRRAPLQDLRIPSAFLSPIISQRNHRVDFGRPQRWDCVHPAGLDNGAFITEESRVIASSSRSSGMAP